MKNGLDPQENLSQELVPEALGDADWAAVIDALNVDLHGSH